MMKQFGKYLAGVIILLFLTSFSAFADVSVFAEGAYTDTDLVVYIYADVTSQALVSYGVKLTYTPAEVDNPTVVKNDNVWYFGTSATPLPTPNAEPDVSTPGTVIIVGGKIDESAPTDGVTGARQLIAVVTFNRVDTETVPTIGLELGKPDPYANFVDVNGELMDDNTESDSPSFTIGAVEIHERGDANGDGYITNTDFFEIRTLMQNNIYKCYADCSGDGYITNTDIFCIRNNM